ncbi:Uncharacterized protein Fot_39155 [Forsythia ovata]|uniref:Uncharacterized protein n=1 Tax=Forsythia ovata TaxID=205694 RepID=A0ABD1S691_9LAMI
MHIESSRFAPDQTSSSQHKPEGCREDFAITVEEFVWLRSYSSSTVGSKSISTLSLLKQVSKRYNGSDPVTGQEIEESGSVGSLRSIAHIQISDGGMGQRP